MFSDASKRKFSVLLFWSLDRFSREGVLETLQHLNRLTSYGVNYRSFTEQYFDSCGVFRDAVISILATIAKQERIRISARAKGHRIGRPSHVPLTDQLRGEIATAYQPAVSGLSPRALALLWEPCSAVLPLSKAWIAGSRGQWI
jgi:hypothetical protein